MKKFIRILVIEDSEDDALLILHQIKKGGYNVDYVLLETAEEMKLALKEKTFDIVLSDYAMPHFNGLEALKVLKESGIDIPFIIISGTIGEDVAVEAMKAGANDYLMKNNLQRLLPAFERELREADNRAERNLLEMEKRMAEKALLESEKRYRRITEGITDYLYTVIVNNGQAVETIHSLACQAITGYSEEDFIMDPFLWFRMIVAEDREKVKEKVRLILTGTDVQPLEHRIQCKDGKIKWISDTSILIKDVNGNLISYDGVIKDITERKVAEEALRTSEERFSKIFHLNPISIAIFSAKDLTFVDVNDVFISSTGYSKSEIIGHTPNELNLFADQNERNTMMNELAEKGYLENFEFKIRNKSGEIGIGLNTTIEIKLGGEKHLLSLIQDITEKVRAEEKLRKLSRAVEQSPVSVIITNIKGEIEYVNDKFTKVTGYSSDEVLGQNPRFLKSGDTSPDNYAELWKTIIGGKEWFGEFHNKKKNGGLFWEFASISPIFDAKGGITHLLAVKEDITERKNSENALLESERKYRIVADNTYNWEFWSDNNGKYIYCSPSCFRVTGFTAEEFIENKDLKYQIVHPDYYDLFQKHSIINSLEALPENLQFKIIHKDVTERWVEHICQPVFDKDGQYLGHRGTNRDITEKKETNRKILNAIISTEESERNKFSQELHDGLGPMLSTVKLYFQWLSETTDSKKQKNITETGLQNIDDAIQTVREISNNLSPRILTNMGLIKALKHLIQRINDTYKLSIKFYFNLDKRFNNQIEITLYRIVSELLNNTLRYAKAQNVSIFFEYDSNIDRIKLNYLDDGIGFDFDKVMENKRGMGINNMMQRISTLNGFINFDTQKGKSLKVRIDLPTYYTENYDKEND